MTDYDYFQLSPRERDAQIAEYVMCYCVLLPRRDNHPGYEMHHIIQWGPYRQLNERHPEDEYYCPEYTSTWGGMGEIQGRMRELGFDKFALSIEEEKWSAYFGKSEKKKKGLLKGVNEDGRAMAENPFDAVALAALTGCGKTIFHASTGSHERKICNVFNTCLVRPELVEG